MARKWGMVVDLDRCTGCEACVVACRAENNVPTAGEDQAARGRAIHWICVERIKSAEIQAEAEKRGLKDGEFDPACVQSCPPKALVFGDLNDLESEVSRLARSRRGTKLLGDLGTLPSVTYLEKDS